MRLLSRKVTLKSSNLNIVRSLRHVWTVSSVLDQSWLVIGQTGWESIPDWAVTSLTLQKRRKPKAHDSIDQQHQSAADELLRGWFNSDLRENGLITTLTGVVVRSDTEQRGFVSSIFFLSVFSFPE